jgi:hypothetical protein
MPTGELYLAREPELAIDKEAIDKEAAVHFPML